MFSNNVFPTRPFLNPEFTGHAKIEAGLAKLVFGLDTEFGAVLWNPVHDPLNKSVVRVGCPDATIAIGEKEGYSFCKGSYSWGTPYEFVPAVDRLFAAAESEDDERCAACLKEVTRAVDEPGFPVFDKMVFETVVTHLFNKRLAKKVAETSPPAQVVTPEVVAESTQPANDQPAAPQVVIDADLPEGAIIVLKDEAVMNALVAAILKDALPSNKDKTRRMACLNEAKQLMEGQSLRDEHIDMLKAAMELVQPNSSKGVRLYIHTVAGDDVIEVS